MFTREEREWSMVFIVALVFMVFIVAVVVGWTFEQLAELDEALTGQEL